MNTQTDLLKTAEAELADIARQVALLTKRRQELVEFVELGRRLYGGQPSLVNINDLFAPTVVAKPPTPRENSLKAKVLASVRDHISLFGPTPTADLLKMLEAEGIEVTGKDKAVTVSVILSRSNEFVSDRKNGWSLAEEKSQQDAGTSAGSSTD